MASSVEQAPAGSSPSAEVVGNAFVHQYYQILHHRADHVHRFYMENSKLGRPEENGVMTVTTTTDEINEKILSQRYDEFTAEIKSVDSQESHEGGVLVIVTGNLTGKDNNTRKFAQTFFLAPQEKSGFFVLNDIFRYVEDIKDEDGDNSLEPEVDAHVNPEQDPSNIVTNHASEQISTLPEEANGEEVYDPSENGEGSVVEEEVPVPEVVDEVQDNPQIVVEATSKVEEVPKKQSYASIVKVAPPLVTQTHTIKTVPRSNGVHTNAAPPPVSAPETISSIKAIENKSYHEEEAVGHSIYIKGLPMNATPALLEAEFKQYGPIKRNGIQVRSNKDFCFGFVEFEVASAVQKAMEASPITFDGHQAVVEEKRSTKMNSRSRFPPGRGTGFRNEGGRGQGNYGGGRGYGRNEFNNRSEFGNRGNRRGGFPNRAGDGYQRADNGGGGRVNRSGGSTFNASAKSVAPGVSASA